MVLCRSSTNHDATVCHFTNVRVAPPQPNEDAVSAIRLSAGREGHPLMGVPFDCLPVLLPLSDLFSDADFLLNRIDMTHTRPISVCPLALSHLETMVRTHSALRGHHGLVTATAWNYGVPRVPSADIQVLLPSPFYGSSITRVTLDQPGLYGFSHLAAYDRVKVTNHLGSSIGKRVGGNNGIDLGDTVLDTIIDMTASGGHLVPPDTVPAAQFAHINGMLLDNTLLLIPVWVFLTNWLPLMMQSFMV